MQTWMRLSIPLILGLFAVYLNTSVMTEKLQPRDLIVVSHSMADGSVVNSADIEKKTFSGNVADLMKAAIPWKDRAIVIGRELPRPLDSGDLILWRDATPPPRELQPKPGEDILPISLNGVDVIPRLLLVGERIGFIIDTSRINVSAGILNSNEINRSNNGSSLVYVGPFRILSVGQRFARTEEEETRSTSQDRTITVAIRQAVNGQLDPKALMLEQARHSGRGGLVSVILHRSNRGEQNADR